MPLMTKIRESLTTFFSVFAGLFVIYIVLDWGMDITGRRHSSRMAESQEVGKINDQPILAKDFSEMVRQATENQKKQTGNEPDENQQRVIRDQIWNQLVEQKLYEEEIKRLGIKVTDQEIVDWVRGDNPPEFLRQQFTDSTGTFNREAYESAIMNPKNKVLMVNIEDMLRRQREREKLQSIIMASVQVSENEIRQRFTDQNTKYTADYAFFDPNLFVKDDELKLSDDDLRRYYNEHSEDFKVEATRKLKYVLFEEKPSKADSESIVRDMDDVLKRAKEGADFTELEKTFSETHSKSDYIKHGDLGPEVENAVFASKVGDIVGPIKASDGYHLIKINDFRKGKDEFIRASHILVNIQSNDSVKALKDAKNIMASVKRGENFAELAKKYSNDPGSGARGGDLGWFGKGRMVKPFEEAAFKTNAGQIVGPVRSQFGYHIIKVVAKDNREAKFIDINLSIRMSSQTKSEISQQAQDFTYLAKQGSFEKEAEQSKYGIIETQPFQKNAVIPGIGTNSSLNKFAFGNKLSTISEPISVQSGYGVFIISDVKEAGVRPFEEVKAQVESRLKREKKIEKTKTIAMELQQTITPSDTLPKLSDKNPNISVQHLAPFTLGGYIPAIGRDLGFIGAISGLNLGEISKPIESQRGIFIIKLLSKSSFDTTAYNSQKSVMHSQILNEKKNRFVTDWLDQLKKKAEIVDKRDMFYR